MKFGAIAFPSFAVVGVALLLLSGAPVASAGRLTPESTTEMRKLIDMLGNIYGKEVGETRFGELGSNQIITLPFDSDATVEYYINVVCDDDCENVDLAVLEADGVEIDTDDADDNSPVLNVHASEYRSVLDTPKGIARPMSIEIRMKACKAETCGYALRVSAVD